eukprot:11207445-Prorocentrum_lima.AAC.1
MKTSSWWTICGARKGAMDGNEQVEMGFPPAQRTLQTVLEHVRPAPPWPLPMVEEGWQATVQDDPPL